MNIFWKTLNIILKTQMLSRKLARHADKKMVSKFSHKGFKTGKYDEHFLGNLGKLTNFITAFQKYNTFFFIIQLSR